MTAPQPGDRVRVIYEGEWSEGTSPAGYRGWVKVVGLPRQIPELLVPDSAIVEVLPTPVYVNSDSTDYKLGDVVRSIDGLIATRANSEDWWVAGKGYVDDEDIARPLTLLVRDGEVKVRA